MAKIYLVRTFTGTFPARLINTFLQEGYVHISISLDEELNDVYGFGRIKSVYPLKGGFQKEVMTEEPFKNSSCEIYEVIVNDEQYGEIKDIIYNFNTNKELYDFNLMGLITAYFKTPWNRQSSYYCSEFVAETLIKTDVLNTNIHPSIIKPSEVVNELNNIKLIYRGNMSEYSKLKVSQPELTQYMNKQLKLNNNSSFSVHRQPE